MSNGSSHMYIDSIDRLYGTASDFLVNFNDIKPNLEKDISFHQQVLLSHHRLGAT
jgi:hypothetical protein